MTIDDDIDWDAPLTATDYAEILADTLDEAVDNLTRREIEQLCSAVRQKLDSIEAEYREEAPVSEEHRYWWQDR